ncbi:DUF2264 domain-containing protein [Gorillibacterium sp. sgz5001074]|uniref:DUF2264 domain-containing protein n=1 Tax=Gorillibacterium sp. sgz5001074 TaxID=3446695 RepID=UPI003F672F3F
MSEGLQDRKYWVEQLVTIAGPVLRNMAERKLKATMPVEGIGDERYDRKYFSHLEAIARTLVGVAPWLETKTSDPEEEKLRAEFAELSRRSIDASTDPESPDYVNWSFSFQPIVDAAFLSHAILRAPNELWHKLDDRVKKNLADALKATRSRKPHFNNWLLFAAMIETALSFMGEEWDHMRVDYALRQHEQWYLGDGAYADGPEYHYDYYNSFVIQPMLVDIIQTVGSTYPEWEALKTNIVKRARRYGEVLERFIAPDGTYPPVGRSLAYRFGCMQHLSQMALQHNLAQDVYPSQVRCALTAVIRRTLSVPNTFDENGWLKIGFTGSQLHVGEMYISTGSLYLCSTVFLALGLPDTDEFWTDIPRDWITVKMWSGQPCHNDHALDHIAI